MEIIWALIGSVSFGAMLTLVKLALDVYKLKASGGIERFKLKSELYGRWINISTEQDSQAEDSTFIDSSSVTMQTMIDSFTKYRNQLHSISGQLQLFVPKKDRNKIEKEFRIFFSLSKDRLELLYQFRNLSSGEVDIKTGKDMAKLFDSLVENLLQLREVNTRIKAIMSKDISL
ncbi:MAG TPA: hypothetical protein VFO38_03805 [Candidatus Saccharimonadales bacterium]|nr:hypothetical protein [Candidatus Saccharimonadales bacterium]